MSDETITTTTKGAETPATVDSKAAIQADIETIKAAIADLKGKGEDLFSEEIANLSLKLKNAEAELESLVVDVKDDAQQLVDELKTYEQSFAQKYGQGIAHGLEIVLLVAVLGKLFGVI